MGIHQEHVLILEGCTHWDRTTDTMTEGDMVKAREIAIEAIHEYLPGVVAETMVTPIMHSPTNGTLTLFVAPDGSKHGWERSHRGDQMREAIMRRVRDACAYVRVIEFGFGELGMAVRTGHDEAPTQVPGR